MNRISPILGAGLAGLLMVPTAGPSLGDEHGDRRSTAQATRFSDLPTRNYRLSAKFGQRGRYWSSGRHTGLDFSARAGTPVMAVGDGKVIFAGWAGAYGKAVIIRHRKGKRSLYAHLRSIRVKRGKFVKSGKRIGRVGSTGNTTGPHLHFEVRSKTGKKLNPRPHLRGE